MGKKDQYEVHKFTGVPVENDASGKYVVKADAKPNVWRTGKHSKGKFKALGQVFLTENNIAIAVIQVEPVAFKDRHGYTAMQRWTSETTDVSAWVK